MRATLFAKSHLHQNARLEAAVRLWARELFERRTVIQSKLHLVAFEGDGGYYAKR
jgi:hypothetical protein